ncbi:DUF5069 domain-containing protein [Akkermansiaceae bacterium]|jgi:hypothetical protein|nr:DUF5069 domain-containing protein [Akkermansiaceae bacterium]MDB4538051.1 DUF5069 domain-containing protein [Akkermansiaceae bacterium]
MSEPTGIPCSARAELGGIIYLPRLLDKIRLMEAGTLHPDFHGNLGRGMDLWTCQFLGVEYNDLRAQVIAGATDDDALAWIKDQGLTRPDYERAWFTSYMCNRGFRDDLSDRLAERKKETPHTDCDDIMSFMDFIEIDEGRSL